MASIFRAVILAATLALATGGCTLLNGTGLNGPAGLASAADFKACAGRKSADGKPITDANGAADPNVIEALLAGLAKDPAAPTGAVDDADLFDQLLDCYVGPADPTDVEQRLLRGHVIVVLLAKYGEYNIRLRRYDGVEDDAAAMLKSIAAAELSLSSASAIVTKAAGGNPPPDTPLIAYARVDRAVDVLQVAIDVERPTYARTKDTVLNIVSAVNGSPAAVRDLLGEAVAVVKKAAVLDLYGPALRADAYNFLSAVKQRGKGKVTLDDWRKWDPILFKVCAPIATLANIQNQCVPSAAAVNAVFTSGQVPTRQP